MNRLHRPWLAILIAISGACGCGTAAPPGYEARGTVEVPEADLAPLVPARMIELRVDEGARVAAGDTLALLTQREMDATLAAARARLAAARAAQRDLEAGSRPEELRSAEAELAAAEAEAERARLTRDRARALLQSNAIARQQHDDAVAAHRIAEERVGVAREGLALARAGARPDRISAARAEAASAAAALDQVRARAADLVLLAPFDGTVLTRQAEPGEVIPAGTPVLSLGETGRPYVRVFVPQRVVTRLAVGDSAVVHAGERVLAGRIAAINPRAEFTPRVALTEEERADLMFAVKVEFLRPSDAPHPGLWVRVLLPGPGSRGPGTGEAR